MQMAARGQAGNIPELSGTNEKQYGIVGWGLWQPSFGLPSLMFDKTLFLEVLDEVSLSPFHLRSSC